MGQVHGLRVLERRTDTVFPEERNKDSVLLTGGTGRFLGRVTGVVVWELTVGVCGQRGQKERRSSGRRGVRLWVCGLVKIAVYYSLW